MVWNQWNCHCTCLFWFSRVENVLRLLGRFVLIQASSHPTQVFLYLRYFFSEIITWLKFWLDIFWKLFFIRLHFIFTVVCHSFSMKALFYHRTFHYKISTCDDVYWKKVQRFYKYILSTSLKTFICLLIYLKPNIFARLFSWHSYHTAFNNFVVYFMIYSVPSQKRYQYKFHTMIRETPIFLFFYL